MVQQMPKEKNHIHWGKGVGPVVEEREGRWNNRYVVNKIRVSECSLFYSSFSVKVFKIKSWEEQKK